MIAAHAARSRATRSGGTLDSRSPLLHACARSHTVTDRMGLDPHELAQSRPGVPIEERGALTTEPWTTLQEVAEHLKVSEDTVHRWIATRAMPAHRIGRVWRFKLSQVDAWVESGQANEISQDEDGGSRRDS